MEKINKEELMKKLNLTEEEMEKVAGGFESFGNDRVNWCCFGLYLEAAGINHPDFSNCKPEEFKGC